MTECVLDASALLALVQNERGGEKVRPFLTRSCVSAVNYCEVVQRLRRSGIPLETVRAILAPLVPAPVPFDEPLAYVAASVYEQTRGQGLSFGDCACLALALSLGVPAVTAEKSWADAPLDVEVILIR